MQDTHVQSEERLTATQPPQAHISEARPHGDDHHHDLRPRDRMLGIIAVFKLVKAILFIGAGVGAFKLLNPVVEERLRQWLLALSFAYGRPFLLHLLSRVSGMSDRRLGALGIVAFAYAALFLTEGIGLWLAQRWAEYLTVIATASLVPVELYEITHGPSTIKIAALITNLAMVAYLVYRLWHDRGTASAKAPAREHRSNASR
jgi:uncharacterized membrane protein (DUF2068 family)